MKKCRVHVYDPSLPDNYVRGLGLALTVWGRFRAAIDVFPQEPFPKNHPLRRINNVLLSAHRAGGLQETHKLTGEMRTVKRSAASGRALIPRRNFYHASDSTR
jgi:phosphoglycerate dehydrogenase-like enzyme